MRDVIKNMDEAMARGAHGPDGHLICCAQCFTPWDLLPIKDEAYGDFYMCRPCWAMAERSAPFEEAFERSFKDGCARCSKPMPGLDDPEGDELLEKEWVFVRESETVAHICRPCLHSNEEEVPW